MTAGTTRRRGAALERAIYDAVFDQLGSVGYGKLTMEGVAAAAQTGKAALYRRWPGKDELVRDALRASLPDPSAIPVTGDLRTDALALLRCHLASINLTREAAFQVVKQDGQGSGLLHAVMRERVTGPVKELLLAALQRGVAAGTVRPDAATAQIASVGPAMLIHRCLNDGFDVPDEALTSIVDDVLLPLVRPAQQSGAAVGAGG